MKSDWPDSWDIYDLDDTTLATLLQRLTTAVRLGADATATALLPHVEKEIAERGVSTEAVSCVASPARTQTGSPAECSADSVPPPQQPEAASSADLLGASPSHAGSLDDDGDDFHNDDASFDFAAHRERRTALRAQRVQDSGVHSGAVANAAAALAIRLRPASGASSANNGRPQKLEGGGSSLAAFFERNKMIPIGRASAATINAGGGFAVSAGRGSKHFTKARRKKERAREKAAASAAAEAEAAKAAVRKAKLEKQQLERQARESARQVKVGGQPARSSQRPGLVPPPDGANISAVPNAAPSVSAQPHLLRQRLSAAAAVALSGGCALAGAADAQTPAAMEKGTDAISETEPQQTDFAPCADRKHDVTEVGGPATPLPAGACAVESGVGDVAMLDDVPEPSRVEALSRTSSFTEATETNSASVPDGATPTGTPDVLPLTALEAAVETDGLGDAPVISEPVEPPVAPTIAAGSGRRAILELRAPAGSSHGTETHGTKVSARDHHTVRIALPDNRPPVPGRRGAQTPQPRTSFGATQQRQLTGVLERRSSATAGPLDPPRRAFGAPLSGPAFGLSRVAASGSFDTPVSPPTPVAPMWLRKAFPTPSALFVDGFTLRPLSSASTAPGAPSVYDCAAHVRSALEAHFENVATRRRSPDIATGATPDAVAVDADLASVDPREIAQAIWFRVQLDRPEIYDLVTAVADDRRGPRWLEVGPPQAPSCVWHLWYSWRMHHSTRRRAAIAARRSGGNVNAAAGVVELPVLAFQWLNRIPGSQALVNKRTLCRIINHLKDAARDHLRVVAYQQHAEKGTGDAGAESQYADSSLNPWSHVVPPSFLLPGADEFAALVDAMCDAGPTAKWIVKPVGSSRARGIYLIKAAKELVYSQQVVVQRYVDRPMLIGGRKWDLRIYVVVTNFHPLEAFISTLGFVRFAVRPYSTAADAEKDLLVHVTNSAVAAEAHQQKAGDGSCSESDESDGASGAARRHPPAEQVEVNKWTLHELAAQWEAIRAAHQATTSADLDQPARGFPTWDEAWASVHEVVVRALAAVEPKIPGQASASVPIGGAFELYGFDVLFDGATGQPWILEVNGSPSMERYGAVDDIVKPLVMDEVLSLAQTRMVPLDWAALSRLLGGSGGASAEQSRGGDAVYASTPGATPPSVREAQALLSDFISLRGEAWTTALGRIFAPAISASDAAEMGAPIWTGRPRAHGEDPTRYNPDCFGASSPDWTCGGGGRRHGVESRWHFQMIAPSAMYNRAVADRRSL